MRGSSVIFGLSVLALAALAGCAHTPPPVVPETTLAAVIEVAPPSASAPEAEPTPEVAPVAVRVSHPVDINVGHLAVPGTLQAKATTYIFWVRGSDEDAWTNAAHLGPSKTPESGSFEFPQETLFVQVTAEAGPDVRRPSGPAVFSARVSRDGACASSVDTKDAAIEVKMCR